MRKMYMIVNVNEQGYIFLNERIISHSKEDYKFLIDEITLVNELKKKIYWYLQ